MPNFFELRVRGHVGETDIVNVFWYMQASETPPTQANIEAIAAAWNAEIRPFHAGVLANTYLYDDITVQGFQSNWERTPYLPYTMTLPGGGVGAGAALPPLVAAICAGRVVPVVAGRRKRADGSIYTSPVRRKYWAIAPIQEADVDSNGTLTPAGQTTGNFYSARVAFADQLDPTGFTVPLVPIAVSRPLENEVARGYGLVQTCIWRSPVSSRRSRKLGKGS